MTNSEEKSKIVDLVEKIRFHHENVQEHKEMANMYNDELHELLKERETRGKNPEDKKETIGGHVSP